MLSHPVIIDGTTQTGFAGSPVITIDGNTLTGSILTLGAGSDGSTIRGLAFTDFNGTAIEVNTKTDLVQSNVITVAVSSATGVLVTGMSDTVQSNVINVTGSNATGVLVTGTQDLIGGNVAAVGNTISYGAGTTAVNASGGHQATIRANVLTTGSNPGTAIKADSNAPSAPLLTSATSSGGITTIEGTAAAGATLDFYATVGTSGPAAIYLGSSSFPAKLNVTVPIGASIVATATSAAGDTSALNRVEHRSSTRSPSPTPTTAASARFGTP